MRFPLSRQATSAPEISPIRFTARARAPAQPVQLYNPFNGQLIPNANLQNSGLPISPIAQGLLQFIPSPTCPESPQNFHYVTSVE